MKKPQKGGYTPAEDSGTNNPVQQLKDQVGGIRKRGKIKRSSGREIEIDQTEIVRGYVLADWNESLAEYLKNDDFIITKQGGHLAYRYFSTLNLMIEVLAFDRLVDRARNRNQAFSDMLEGRSNYDRSSTKTFS